MIRVGTYVCVQKKYLNPALSADSPPERLAEALSLTSQTNDSIEELRGDIHSTILNFLLKRTELTIYRELALELIRLMTPYFSTI